MARDRLSSQFQLQDTSLAIELAFLLIVPLALLHSTTTYFILKIRFLQPPCEAYKWLTTCTLRLKLTRRTVLKHDKYIQFGLLQKFSLDWITTKFYRSSATPVISSQRLKQGVLAMFIELVLACTCKTRAQLVNYNISVKVLLKWPLALCT